MEVAFLAFLLQISTPVDVSQEVVILVNKALPVSVRLGEYYADRRRIPRTQILSLETSVEEAISWPDYREQIEKPLRLFLESRRKVKYIVPLYGIPLKTTEENRGNDKHGKGGASKYVENRDYACIDREIELLRKDHSLEGWIRSGTFQLDRSITRKDGVYIVCRLDGPSPESVSTMIDNAIYGETYGIEGSSLLDTRGLTEGTYGSIDREMKNIASIYERYGIDFEHDDVEAVVRLGTRAGQAHYWGWYTSHGKMKKGFRFHRGAVGAHLHSFSAKTVRKPNAHWVGPLVHHGITATCGTVYEPLSVGFPFGTIFLDRFFQGYGFGESMQMANMFTSWMAVFVGDPLYAPYAEGRAEAQARNRNLIQKGGGFLEDALDKGNWKEAKKVAAEMAALPEFPLQGAHIRFLVREIRARSLSSLPVFGSVGDLWKAIIGAKEGDALRNARKGLSISPNNYECNLIAGEALLGRKKGKEALFHLRRAVMVDPTSGRARHALGRTLLLLKKPGEALLSLEEAYRSEWKVSILIQIGVALLLQGDYAEVVKRLEPILGGDPRVPPLVGRALLGMKDPARAVKILEKAPLTVDDWSLLAKAYKANREREKAKAATAVVKSFSARKRADLRGSRRESIRKRVGEAFAKGLEKFPTPLVEKGPRGLPVLLLANKSGWTLEVLIDGALVRSENLPSVSNPRTVSVPLYVGKSRIVVVAKKGKEEKIFTRRVLFECGRVYSLGFESLTKLYPLKP